MSKFVVIESKFVVIEVTKKDIEEWHDRTIWPCPIWRALVRKGYDPAVVTRTGVRLRGSVGTFPLSKTAQKFVERVDDKWSPAPKPARFRIQVEA